MSRIPAKLISLIRDNRDFLIVSHLRPDGDAIASSLALSLVLKALGKRTVIFNQDAVPPNFAFLPGAGRIQREGPPPFSPQAVFLLDSPSPERLGRGRDFLEKGLPTACIDHHVSNLRYAGLNWVDADSPCTGEMILRLGARLDVGLDRDLAECVYVSLLTDMGKFQFMTSPRSGAKVFALAAHLTSFGLVPYEIYKKVFNVYSRGKLELLGVALNNLHVSRDGQIAYISLDRAVTRRFHYFDDTNDGLIAHPRDLAATRVALLFAEGDGKVKVSFRSKEPACLDVNAIATQFGGGGHPAAAGATVPGSLDSVRRRVLRAVRRALAGAPPRAS